MTEIIKHDKSTYFNKYNCIFLCPEFKEGAILQISRINSFSFNIDNNVYYINPVLKKGGWLKDHIHVYSISRCNKDIIYLDFSSPPSTNSDRIFNRGDFYKLIRYDECDEDIFREQDMLNYIFYGKSNISDNISDNISNNISDNISDNFSYNIITCFIRYTLKNKKNINDTSFRPFFKLFVESFNGVSKDEIKCDLEGYMQLITELSSQDPKLIQEEEYDKLVKSTIKKMCPVDELVKPTIKKMCPADGAGGGSSFNFKKYSTNYTFAAGGDNNSDQLSDEYQ